MSEEFNEENVTMADLEDHFDDANPWNVVQSYLEKGTVLPVKIEGIVNGGAIAMVEGIRGFIPASRLSLSYIEDLESYLLKDIEVQVIDVDKDSKKLILSAKNCKHQSRKRSYRNRRIPPELRCICTSGRRTFRTCTRFPDQPETYQIPKRCPECR